MTIAQRIYFLVMLSILSLLFFLPSSSAHAAFGLPFGGMIIVKIDGLCEEGSQIILGPNGRPGSYMYISGTTVYDSGPPSAPGQQMLGLSQGYLTCSRQIGPYRVVFGAYPLISVTHGTSSL